MTIQEFKNKIKHKPNFYLYSNFFICLVPIIIGFILFIKISALPNTYDDLLHKLIYILPFLLIFIGLLCLYIILKTDDFEIVYSNMSVNDKQSVINEYIIKINADDVTINNGIINCHYFTLFKSHLELIASVDSEKILFKVRSDFGVYTQGVTDFGLSYRHLKRFKKYLCKSFS